MELIILRKLIRSSAKKIFAISFTVISLSIGGSSSSLSKETEPLQASPADIALYSQIFTNYFCIARGSNVKFDEAFSLASKNITRIILNKHGGLLEELDGKKLTNNQLLNGSASIIMAAAISTCPNKIPEKKKKEFENFNKEQRKVFEQKNKDN